MTTALMVAGEAPRVGTLLGESIADDLEADVALAIRNRSLLGAQRRLSELTGQFRKLVADLTEAFRADEADLAELYITGCRAELTACYLGVIRSGDEAARARITEVVGNVIERALAGIEQARTAAGSTPPVVLVPKPPARRAAGSRSS